MLVIKVNKRFFNYNKEEFYQKKLLKKVGLPWECIYQNS